MRKIFLIALLCGLTAYLTACARINGEYPIKSTGFYKNNVIFFDVITRERSSNRIFVLIRGIDVRLRDDGKDYTSIIISESLLFSYDYNKGTILVPNAADVQKWNEWLETLKQKPKRVLPPNLNQ